MRDLLTDDGLLIEKSNGRNVEIGLRKVFILLLPSDYRIELTTR